MSLTLYVTLRLGCLNFICHCPYVVIEVSELCPLVLLFILTSLVFFVVVLLAVFCMLHTLFSAISATFFHSSSFTSGVMDSYVILFIMCFRAALLCNLIYSIVLTSSITVNEGLFEDERGRLVCEYYVKPLTPPSCF
jgi:hypothetical protein